MLIACDEFFLSRSVPGKDSIDEGFSVKLRQGGKHGGTGKKSFHTDEPVPTIVSKYPMSPRGILEGFPEYWPVYQGKYSGAVTP